MKSIFCVRRNNTRVRWRPEKFRTSKQPGIRIKCLTAVGIIAVVTAFPSCTKSFDKTIQAGSRLPSPSMILGVDDAAYVAGFNEDCVNHAGTYTIPMTDGTGKTYELRLTVIDTKKPVVTPKHVYYAQGTGEPRAEDFIGSIIEPDTYTAYFDSDPPDLSLLGDFDVTFRVVDASGNVSAKCKSVMTVIKDSTPPTFESIPELSAYVGEAIAYRKNLVVTDNCSGPVEINVNTDNVNSERAGDYAVYFTATDAAGNRATAQSVVHVYDNRVSEEQLNAKVDALLLSLVSDADTTENKLRKVYDYLQTNIAYTSDSDKSDWVRAAYDGLFVSGGGDCFTYFAAAKAILRRLGIPFYEIQRTPGAAEGTHYWLMVNIGTPDTPKWYHYDCTRLRAAYNHSGCLLTDKQVAAYNKVRSGFYAYNKSNYPQSSSLIITPTPSLEPYY